MLAMIDLTEKGAEWVERWEEVTFTPSHLFAKTKFKLDSSAFLHITPAVPSVLQQQCDRCSLGYATGERGLRCRL
jgi:hypothetical protein